MADEALIDSPLHPYGSSPSSAARSVRSYGARHATGPTCDWQGGYLADRVELGVLLTDARRHLENAAHD